MDDTTKLLGKILGEIYRLQQKNDNITIQQPDSKIYALLNGFERTIKEELEVIGYVSDDHIEAVVSVINPIWMDEEKLENFTGYYDIEPDLKSRGIDRVLASKIFKYFKANGQFIELIDKMNSNNSPVECKNFELTDWDI